MRSRWDAALWMICRITPPIGACRMYSRAAEPYPFLLCLCVFLQAYYCLLPLFYASSLPILPPRFSLPFLFLIFSHCLSSASVLCLGPVQCSLLLTVLPPAPLPGRLMCERPALTSLQALRHRMSVFPAPLSLIPSPRHPSTITALFFFF